MEWEIDYKGLWDSLNEFAANEKFLLIGDCNASIGEGQKVSEEIVPVVLPKSDRSFKDKLINRKGRRSLELCENFNLIVLNGCTKGDMAGEYTFIDSGGLSVVDEACISPDSFELINEFAVLPMHFSDHLPIRVKVAQNFVKAEEAVLPLLLKLGRVEQDQESFQRKLSGRCEGFSERLSRDNNEAVNQLKNLILECAYNKNPYNAKSAVKGKQVWFDRNCRKTRDCMFSFLNLLRRVGAVQSKQEYLAVRKVYRLVCKKRNIFKRHSYGF